MPIESSGSCPSNRRTASIPSTSGVLAKSAARLLVILAQRVSPDAIQVPVKVGRNDAEDAGSLVAADLATWCSDGRLAITQAGIAHVARLAVARNGAVDPFQGQH